MSGAWGVFMLFLIPVGGGIPAGVVLARQRGIPWPAMSVLYLVSDVVLAVVFEPIMHGLIGLARRTAFMERFVAILRETIRKTTSIYGNAGGPLSLIAIAFATDPMTGRAATHAAGHGFVSGWSLSIAGDMFYFWLLMVSTLWLNSVFGNGDATIGVMMLLMIFVPAAIKRWREKRAARI